MKGQFYGMSRCGFLSPPFAEGIGSYVFEAGKLRYRKQPQSQSSWGQLETLPGFTTDAVTRGHPAFLMKCGVCPSPKPLEGRLWRKGSLSVLGIWCREHEPS